MNTYWRADGLWGCNRHLVSQFPATLKKCYYSDCGKMCSGRPELNQRVAPVDLCSMNGCGKTKRDGSKYCSDYCRKNYARSRYVEKMRNKRDGLQQITS